MLHTVENVPRIFYPGAVYDERYADGTLELELASTPRLSATANYICEGEWQTTVTEDHNGDEKPANQLRRLARMAIYQTLSAATGHVGSPWGILTGIRPTKIVHRWLDRGFLPAEITCLLQQRYLVSQETAERMVTLAQRQRPFLLSPGGRKTISLYVGIPFCPTRCIYCSFAAEPLTRSRDLVAPYLAALKQEAAGAAAAFQNLGIQVENIYLGGGTPTSLENDDFRQLLAMLHGCFWTPGLKEFTVEAGRPETLNRNKFQAMADWGVGRISINPQSMHQATLDLVGRQHSIGAVKDSFHLAREFPFQINMDVILGLPGENLSHVQSTLAQIGQLQPDNLTVHTLAVKRHSQLQEERYRFPLATPEEAERMIAASRQTAEAWGMHPYYLYRQKNMLGQLENTGYCYPGGECRYNINIIEERQTIIGLGAGAGSKFMDHDGGMAESFYNPKDIPCYISRVDELRQKKIDKLALFV